MNMFKCGGGKRKLDVVIDGWSAGRYHSGDYGGNHCSEIVLSTKDVAKVTLNTVRITSAHSTQHIWVYVIGQTESGATTELYKKDMGVNVSGTFNLDTVVDIDNSVYSSVIVGASGAYQSQKATLNATLYLG